MGVSITLPPVMLDMVTLQQVIFTYGSNTILFSAGLLGTAYTEYWKIWIDYNQNGTFETSEE
jgi:hypothetical protein